MNKLGTLWMGEEGVGDTVKRRGDGGERKVHVECHGAEGRKQ